MKITMLALLVLMGTLAVAQTQQPSGRTLD
jgi:hypothetical protein